MRELIANKQRYLVSEEAMTVHLIEDRRAGVSPWGLGNSKLGPGVYTYSKLPGLPCDGGSCPGATPYCRDLCYVQRMLLDPFLCLLYSANSQRGDELPPLPEGELLVRGHISGDFDTEAYIRAWFALAQAREECLFWFYTRSWRVPELLPWLEALRQLPNVQLIASVDPECEMPPEGWRRAWFDTDERAPRSGVAPTVPCPEEVGKLPNCEACGYCFRKTRGDVVFIAHRGD